MTDIENIEQYMKKKAENHIHIQNEVMIGEKKYSFSLQEIGINLLSMYLPDEIMPMNETSAKLKYPVEDRPDIILTTLDETINFLFTPTDFEFTAAEAKNAMDGFRAVIKRLHPSFTICEPQRLQTQQGKEVYWFDYRSPVLETELYNLMYVTDVCGTLLLGGFNCLAEDRRLWKILILQMMETVAVKE